MFQAAPVRLYDHGCVNDVNLTRGFGKTSHAGELRSAPLLFTQVCLLWKFGATNPECEHLENFEVVHHPAVVWNLQFSQAPFAPFGVVIGRVLRPVRSIFEVTTR